jgi:hypothetical protein
VMRLTVERRRQPINSHSEALAQIISAGVARFEATLPAYAQRSADIGQMDACPNLAIISAERQREICLNCPLADCVGVANDQCPIRVEARRRWRERDARR